ncbi:hypothetical protein ACSMXM_01255 [Pacificimonas sp. ICDLI1SI03]
MPTPQNIDPKDTFAQAAAAAKVKPPLAVASSSGAAEGVGRDERPVPPPQEPDEQEAPKGAARKASRGGSKSDQRSTVAEDDRWFRPPTELDDFGKPLWIDRDDGVLPDRCPVKPLGQLGDIYFYLDAMGQVRAVKDKDHKNKMVLLGLFGSQAKSLPQKLWPRSTRLSDKNDLETLWKHNGMAVEDAGADLMTACSYQGIWSPEDKERGRGAHRGPDGELILHCGDKIYIHGDRPQWRDPGMIGDMVYPAAPKGARPHEAPVPEREQVGAAALTLLKTWRFKRAEMDAMLLLGWVGAAMLGGAPDWRPMIWLTGSKGTGKSSLQKLLEHWLGGRNRGLLYASDATEAGIRQILGHQTLPVALDEQESEEDNRKLQSLVKLARQAASGGNAVRGGQDHKGHSFTIRAAFLFSSILIPPMQGQDLSRLGVLELNRFEAWDTPPPTAEQDMLDMGAKLRRRMVDGWGRFDATLRQYQLALQANGHNGRGQDQFGTLLTCCDLMMFDRRDDPESPAPVDDPDDSPLSTRCEEWAEMFAAHKLAEKQEDVGDEERCAIFLSTTHLPSSGGREPRPVADWIVEALTATDMDGHAATDAAVKRLGNNGMRVISVVRKDNGQYSYGPPVKGDGSEIMLAVASADAALARLFRDEIWQARSGTSGVWRQSLSRLDGAIGGRKTRIGMADARGAVWVPLRHFVEVDAQGWPVADSDARREG